MDPRHNTALYAVCEHAEDIVRAPFSQVLAAFKELEVDPMDAMKVMRHCPVTRDYVSTFITALGTEDIQGFSLAEIKAHELD